MRLGVYIAAGPNPIFMRMLMMQIARQTKLPDYIAVYENGNKTSGFHWACKEIIEQLESKGIKILHKHNSNSANYVKRYAEPLRMILSTESDVFLKMDLDDFYSDQYIENTTNMLGESDWAININSGIVLVRPFHGDFKYKEKTVLSYSPVGGAPTHVSFNRKFAIIYLDFMTAMEDKEGVADDELMAGAIKHVNAKHVEGPVDYTYVSHGNNQSSASWQSTGGRVYFDN